MKVKLKEEIINSVIYVPFMNQNVLGKFIPEGLYEKMYQKYPELFEIVKEEKKSKKDVIFINDSE